MIPTQDECVTFFRRYGMLDHIEAHSRRVADVAMFLAQQLASGGNKLNLPLTLAGALLHDITKTICILTKENHAATGSALIAQLGYAQVADIIRQHVRLDPGVADSDIVTEAELVNYADKRVKHSQVVPVEERFRDLALRYGKNRKIILQRLDQLLEETRKIEKKVFSKIDISPDQLGGLLP